MSIIPCKNDSVFVNHQKYLKDLYQITIDNAESKNIKIFSFIPKPCYFVITTPHILTKRKSVAAIASDVNENIAESSSSKKLQSDICTGSNIKRKKKKRKLPLNESELKFIQYHETIKDHLINSAVSMIDCFKKKFALEYIIKQDVKLHDVYAEHFHCSFIQEWKESLKSIEILNSSLVSVSNKQFCYCFENDCDFSHLVTIKETFYLIPMHCKCICSDISNLKPLLKDCKINGCYSCVLLDPPWENKSVKRSKMYNALDFNQISEIPFDKLCENNCLIVVWVTNKQKIKQWLKESLFKKWNITFLTEWHWIKLTASGEPVFPWDSLHKKPYETLIIGCYQHSKNTSDYSIPHLVIGSMPSTIHSHKPPISEIIKTYGLNGNNKNGRCLEMFARCLTSGWTSWGNEVLMLQDVKYFDQH